MTEACSDPKLDETGWKGIVQLISHVGQIFTCFSGFAVLLFKGFEPLIGAANIQYANGEDWDQRQKCLYKTLKGEELKGYFPKFVSIAQVSNQMPSIGGGLDPFPSH
jgi:hypothetical protein